MVEDIMAGKWNRGEVTPRTKVTAMWTAAILGWGTRADWQRVAVMWQGVGEEFLAKERHTLLHTAACVRLKHGVELVAER